MRPTWVRTPSELPERTQLLLRRNNDAEDAEWLVLVAICGTDIRADFSGQPATESDDTALRLVLSSNRVGRTTLCDTAAYIACASDPYMAIRAATQTAARQLGIRTRKERPFPDALTGLGWCTWDSLGRDVNEQAIVNKMEEFQAKHVPISWVLIDDGWSNTDRTKETLIDFGADRQRFPTGCPHHCAAQNALWRAQRRRVAGVPRLLEWFGRIGCSRGQLPDRNNHHGEWLPDSWKSC